MSLRKRPLSDFEDPRLEGNFDPVDFECILQVAVFCVAKSSKDRPTIDTVFEEMDRAWNNTLGNMVCTSKPLVHRSLCVPFSIHDLESCPDPRVALQKVKKETSFTATSMSNSFDVIQV